MTDGFSSPVLGGGGALIRDSAHSPNYAAGSSGWTINSDGSAEFNNVVYRGTFEGTNYIQNADGIFQYNGTPTAGNLIGSWAANAGTDAFGNKYLDGICSYATPQINGIPFIQLDPINGAYVSGQWKGTNWDTANAATMTVLDADSGLGLQLSQYILKTPVNTVFPDSLTMLLQGGSGGQTTGSASAPQVQLFDKLGTSPVDVYQSGTTIKTTNNGTPYTWQTPSAFSAGWASGSTASANYQPVQFRLTPHDEVHVFGAAHATAATPSNTVLTLPAGYRPQKLARGGTPAIMPGGALVSTTSADALKLVGRVNLQDNGALVIGGFTVAISDNFYFDHYFPLGNIT